MAQRILATALLLSAVLLCDTTADLPLELCARTGNHNLCVLLKGANSNTNTTALADARTPASCFSVAGWQLDQDSSCSTLFTVHKPQPGMLEATPGVCLSVTTTGFRLEACDGNKVAQRFLAGYRAYYGAPCASQATANGVAEQCACTAKHTPQELGPLTVTPHCLEGRVKGSLMGRLLAPISSENLCTGQPMPMNTLPAANKNMAYVYWAEDAATRVHIELVDFSNGAAIVAHIALEDCSYNGGIAMGKDGRIAVLCAEKKWEAHMDVLLVEVAADLSVEVRRASTLPPSCSLSKTGTDCGVSVPATGAADFRVLQYSSIRDEYYVFFNADVDNEQSNDMYSPLRGDSLQRTWTAFEGCTEQGSTATGRLAYNDASDEMGLLCCSDGGAACAQGDTNCDASGTYKNGLTYHSILNSGSRTSLAPIVPVAGQALSGWPGDVLPCDNGFVVAWHSADGLKDEYGRETNDVGFARLSMGGDVIVKKWISKTADRRERSVKLARLGTGCDRFLFGWGEMGASDVYPTRYLTVELDKDGNKLTEVLDVTSVTMWHEDSQWATLGSGDVAWTHTWKRNDDGTPNSVGTTTYGAPTAPTCTLGGGGYGFSTADNVPGTGFHTNEAFTTFYKAGHAAPLPPQTDECLANPCSADQTCTDVSTSTPNDFTCTCTANTSISAIGAPAVCLDSFDECASTPCGAGQLCHDPDTTNPPSRDFTCTCTKGNTTVTGGRAICTTNECDSRPCGPEQTCSDADESTHSDFTCTCDKNTSLSRVASRASCPHDECTENPCWVGQTCHDAHPLSDSLGDFVCTCPLYGEEATGRSAVCKEASTAPIPTTPLPTTQIPATPHPETPLPETDTPEENTTTASLPEPPATVLATGPYDVNLYAYRRAVSNGTDTPESTFNVTVSPHSHGDVLLTTVFHGAHPARSASRLEELIRDHDGAMYDMGVRALPEEEVEESSSSGGGGGGGGGVPVWVWAMLGVAVAACVGMGVVLGARQMRTGNNLSDTVFIEPNHTQNLELTDIITETEIPSEIEKAEKGGPSSAAYTSL